MEILSSDDEAAAPPVPLDDDDEVMEIPASAFPQKPSGARRQRTQQSDGAPPPKLARTEQHAGLPEPPAPNGAPSAPAAAGASAPKQKKRLQPQLVTPAAQLEQQRAAEAAAAAAAEAAREAAASSCGGAADDAADADADAVAVPQSLEEKHALLAELRAAMADEARLMRMLETGADDRTLGEAHPRLAAARLDAERELLAELRDEGLSGAALTARCADALADFQQELADAYDDAQERVVELHEAFDDCGGLSAAEWRAFEADFASVDAPPAAAGISDGEASHLPLLRFLGGASPGADAARPPTPPISGALCRQCHRPGVVAPLARVSDEMREALEGLCAVCAAETELAASNALIRTTDGRLPGGADGFNGWTSGLKRSRDPKALKRMYKADTLKQLEALDEAELEVPGGLEIEEIAPCDDLNGADDGGDGSDDDDSDDGGVSLALAIASKRVDRKKQQRAWRNENKAVPHNNVAKHDEKEDGAEERRPLDTCTVCCLPFFESTTVHAHPELGVALCFYCHDAAEAFAAGGAVTAEQSCLWCGGASERNDDDAEASGELLGCDDCHRWVCAACVRRNFGDDELSRVRAAESWTCYACDPAALGDAQSRCAAMLRRRARAPRRAYRTLAADADAAPAPAAAPAARSPLPRVLRGGGAPPGTFSNVTPPSRECGRTPTCSSCGRRARARRDARRGCGGGGGVARGASQGAPA